MIQAKWVGDTYPEKVALMKQSLLQEGTTHQDTIIVLGDQTLDFQCDFKVAHISRAGWVDIFQARVHLDNPNENVLRHVSLTPGQVCTLMDALNELVREEPSW